MNQDTDARNATDATIVRGMIVKPLEKLYKAPLHNVFEFLPARDVSNSFRAAVFYIPPHAENKAARRDMPEGTIITVSTLMPVDAIEKAMHFPGTITFDRLTVSGHHAVDPRNACQIEGTDAFRAKVDQATRRTIGQPQRTSPCAGCKCPGGQKFTP